MPTCWLTYAALTANKLFLIKPNWPQKFLSTPFSFRPSGDSWPSSFPFLSHDNL